VQIAANNWCIQDRCVEIALSHITVNFVGMWALTVGAVALLFLVHSDGLIIRGLPNSRTSISSSSTRLSLFDGKLQSTCDSLIARTSIPSITLLLAALLASPAMAGAAVEAPVSVFEDPAIAKQVIGGLVVGVAWIVPYFILNVIIAPKIGLIEEDPATDLKNKTRDFF
jgi:hypothetical protein